MIRADDKRDSPAFHRPLTNPIHRRDAEAQRHRENTIEFSPLCVRVLQRIGDSSARALRAPRIPVRLRVAVSDRAPEGQRVPSRASPRLPEPLRPFSPRT